MKTCKRCGAHLRRGHRVSFCDPCFSSVLMKSENARSIVLYERPEWWTEAGCRLEDSELFFPEILPRSRDNPMIEHGIRKAKHYCVTCPVRKECLLDCLMYEKDTGESQPGIWGGTLSSERRGLGPEHADILLDRMDRQAEKHGLKGAA